MDGLARLAAAADLVESSSVPSRNNQRKRKRTAEPKAVSSVEAPSHIEPSQSSDRTDVKTEATENLNIEKINQLMTPALRLRAIHEWFYSTLDRDYFKENEFLACLHSLGYGLQNTPALLSRPQWSVLRGAMGSRIGRPRRFSPAFLLGERRKLEEYRRTVRRIQFEGTPMPPYREFPYEVNEPVSVGDCVTALHEASCSLQRGQVLSREFVDENGAHFLVQFDSVEMGHAVVRDEWLAVHGQISVLHRRKRAAEVRLDTSVSAQKEHEGGDMETVWSKCIAEAKRIVTVSLTENESVELTEALVPCIASLLFIRSPDKNIIEPSGNQGGNKEVTEYSDAQPTETEIDINVSKFLSRKMQQHFTPSAELLRKLTMLFMLANNMSRVQQLAR